MTKRQKLIELSKKLREMALKGTPNEQASAQDKLDKICVKYGINIEELFFPKPRKKRVFKLKCFGDEKNLLIHSILDTYSEAKILGNEQLRQIQVQLSDTEHKEVQEKFNFYWGQYLEEREALLSAFIIKNNIGIIDSDKAEEIDKDVNAIIEYMDIIKASKFKQKQIV